MDLLSSVKLLLGATDSSKDDLIDYYVQSSVRKVLDYCNITALPEGAEYIVAEIAADAYNTGTGSAVESIKEGDTQVTYAGNESSFSRNHTKLLNSYRRVKLR